MPTPDELADGARDTLRDLVAPFYAIVTTRPPNGRDAPPTYTLVPYTDTREFERAVARALHDGPDAHKFLRCEPLEYSLKLVRPHEQE